MSTATITLTQELPAGEPSPGSLLHSTSLQEYAVSVTLPTHTSPSRRQHLIGRPSPVAHTLQEFRGIPYGVVPARWKHSTLRAQLPSDEFDATRYGPRCPQPWEPNNTGTFQSPLDFPLDVKESEFDCLNLFVVRPSPAALAETGFDYSTHKLPVYFYIHGGAFAFGAGTDPMWDPTRLVSAALSQGKPMIAVHINYRLNLFGFAASSDIIDSQSDTDFKGCNFGLGDQRIALEWVAQNISCFGGDPTRISIGGQSAGANSVHAHVIEAKFGQGNVLFQRAIIQSGAMGTIGPLSLAEADLQWERLYKDLQSSADKEQSPWALLSTASASELVQAGRDLSWSVVPLVEDSYTIRSRPGGRWTVHLERSVRNPDDSTPEHTSPIHILIGDTDAEASLHINAISQYCHFEQMKARFQASCQSASTADELLGCYGFHNDLSAAELQERLMQFLTDVQFGCPVESARHELLSSSNGNPDEEDHSNPPEHKSRPSKTQSYRICFGNPFSGQHNGVAQHCVDLIYIYDAFHDALMNVDEECQSFSVSNQELVRNMQSQWIGFIANDVVESVPEDIATVYETDRRCRLVSMIDDSVWVERKQRFAVLRRQWADAQKVVQTITG